MTLVSWCHHDSYVYRLGHCHVGRRRPSCAVYTILAHFGSESCCRLRKTEFFSKLTHFLLIAGFKSFSFARFSTFLGLSFSKTLPFLPENCSLHYSRRYQKKRMCLRLQENYSFLIFLSKLCFFVLSFFQNPWNAILGSHVWNFRVAMSGRSLARTGRPTPEKHEKCLWRQRQAHFSSNMPVAPAACVFSVFIWEFRKPESVDLLTNLFTYLPTY